MAALSFAAACKAEPMADDPPSKDKEPTGMSELGTSTSGDGIPEVEGDLCPAAPSLLVTTHEGSLFNAAADLAAVDIAGLDCRFDGPDAFFRFTTPARADVAVSAVGTGFAPIVAVLGASCTEAFACADGLPAAMLDVAAGTELVIAVGLHADDPAATSAMAPDDLGFRVAIDLREVLVAGAPCGLPGQGRCETGSACMDDELGVAQCTVVAGDTCTTATPIDLDAGIVTTMIDPAVPYDDAHQHSCAGARRRDRVLLVRWTAAAGTLVASTAAPGVALALRGPGCAASEELDCATAAADGTRAATSVVGPGSAYVFVELAADDATSEVGPFTVDLAIEP